MRHREPDERPRAARRFPLGLSKEERRLKEERERALRSQQHDGFAEHRHMIEERILSAFEDLEAAAAKQEQAARYLQHRIEEDPTLQWPDLWQSFLAAGGLSSKELKQWLRDRRQIRPARQRRHLRLVASGERRRPGVVWNSSGPDAA
jgi:hypothetical protein